VSSFFVVSSSSSSRSLYAVIMNEDICREGMWLSEEVLLSKSTWDKKTLGKLRRGGILHSESVYRVSDIDGPLSSLRFYRVKASSDSETGFGPAEDLGVVLSKFIDMCDILEKFSAGGAEPLSSYILDRLQKYTGVPILPSSPLHFIVFIERLRKENYVMFSEDVAKYEQTDVSTDCPVDERTSNPVDTPAPTGNAVDTPAPTGNTVGTPAPTGNTVDMPAAAGNTVDTLAPKTCAGVDHPTLLRALAVSPQYVHQHWNIVNGLPVSKSCNGIIDENEIREGRSCSKCRSSYKNIKRSRHPLLFDDNESFPDKYTLDSSTIGKELLVFWRICAGNEETFRMRSEVKFLCRLMVFRGETGDVLLNTNSYEKTFLICCRNAGQKHPLCQPVGTDLSDGACATPEVRKDECEVFCIVSRRKGEKRRMHENCCNTCQRVETNQRRKRNSRERDAGKMFSIGSKVNRSLYTLEESQKFIKNQAAEIKRLNKLILKQAAESIQRDTETISESVEGSAGVRQPINQESNRTSSERRIPFTPYFTGRDSIAFK
jgi:hypothetical protein